MAKKKYNYFYQIKNKLNGKFYYGIHSTDDLDDGYMGSGARLRMCYKINGIENFEKEILKFFNTREEASKYEAEIVTEELVNDKNCYNIRTGGDYGLNIGSVLYRDKSGMFHRFKYNDDEINKDEYVPFSKGMVIAKKKDESNFYRVDFEEFHTKRNLYETPTDGLVTATDGTKFFKINKNDKRLIDGSLKLIWSDRKHNEATKEKMSKTHKMNGDQIGIKNSQYGTCWITNGDKNMKIKKEDLTKYISEGWYKGRITKK